MKRDFLLKNFTTMRMGGPARYFVSVRSEPELAEAVKKARDWKLPSYVVGEGSNLIVSDRGYPGVVISNRIEKFARKATVVTVGAGNNLLKLIFKLDKLGWAGLEKMAGIPGTVGGAVYGSAGAYGSEIKSLIVRVRYFDGHKFRNLSRKQCRFGYRDSVFKRNKNWTITEVVLQVTKGDRERLLETSKDIIKLRAKKYPPGMRCPGSFFKNIKLADLRPAGKRKAFVRRLAADDVMYGKVPAGRLLDRVGARGMKQGQILVAAHHANLIYNPGRGRAADVQRLAKKLKKLVKNRFGVTIEEEVQYLGF